ncbi:uncharacterized protein TM35_000121100 [Trypanosoma theileri]|uniref:BAR domain-containing protein n=1 Tax=Trypanosoma theileri TaxID=67003 RepID=A0A1X0NXA6_9TRYP|nr:uncharacterized protein TM35_000121100 [Trypanosoma theileri]ORC89335.1 hypothetical protein TM35_000121100 [Trypanosoma theileri]
MDRLKLNTKALLGMATRTVDQDHEMRHTCVRSFNQAVAQYEVAMSKFVTSLTMVSNSLEGVEKAFKDVVANEKQTPIFDGMKEITKCLEIVRTSILNESIDTFKIMVVPSLSSLKGDCETCDKIHTERAKAVDLYDYHRDVVEKKEVQYASKGKPLDDSKRYKEELSKRDSANEEYLLKNTEYNNAYDLLMSKKSELTTVAAKLFLHWLSDFSEKLHHESSRMCDVVDNTPVKTMDSEMENAVVTSHEVSSQVDAPNGVESQESVNGVNTASMVDDGSNVEQPLSTNIDASKEEGEAVPTSETG